MLMRELTTRECHDVLKRASIARLGCARDNQPYVVPVHVYFDGDYLYSFAMLGQKIAWMRENPRVCVEVDEIVDRTARLRAAQLRDDAERAAVVATLADLEVREVPRRRRPRG